LIDRRPHSKKYAAFFNGVKNAFQVPGRANMNDMASAMKQITAQFPDPGVLGNFLANHDVSRFRSVTASDSVAYNALVWQHLFDGIPITYYGEEQEIKTGGSDPDQRQALWAAGMGNYSTNTKTYKRIKTLNTVRKFLMSSAARVPPGNKTYLQDRSNVVLSSAADLVFTKGPALIVVNNVSRLSIDGQTKFQ
jgi:alpha-amylase